MVRESRNPVLILSRSGPIGGLQRQLLYLASGLDRQRFPLTVAVNETGSLRDELLAQGVDAPIYRMSSWRSLNHVVSRYLDAHRLLDLARANHIRLVHAQDVWHAEYARFIAERLDIPYVVHVRGPLAPRDIRKHRLHLADSIIAVSPRIVDHLISGDVESQRITLVDDAVDLAVFSPAQVDPNFLQRSLGVQGSPLVGLVGRVTPFKCICEFLEIVALLPSDVSPSARFLIVGDWEEPGYRHETENVRARLRLKSRVHFLGRCASQDMPSILAGLDLLVTLSGGSVMYEAMAMEKPVLSIRPDTHYFRNLRHDHTAWCVSADQPAPAAAALARLLEDTSLRRRLGTAGRAWVEQHLSSPIMVAKTEALYDSLLAH